MEKTRKTIQEMYTGADREMLEKAYTVRDRYTVLTLVHELGLTETLKPLLMAKYF